MNYTHDKVLKTALEAAKAAGNAVIRARRDNTLTVQAKDDTSLVTSTDLEAERIIVETIHREYPHCPILAEESSPAASDLEDLLGPLWIVDPIDGTTNFARGHHHVGISIAFALKGEVQVGVVHLPFLEETFSAVRGSGARLNGLPIRTGTIVDLKRAIVATGFPATTDRFDLLARRVEAVLAAADDIRRIGAASVDICWVAAGRMDAYYEDVKPWDMAAAALIAREAGARVGHYKEHPEDQLLPPELRPRGLLVAVPAIYPRLAEILAAVG